MKALGTNRLQGCIQSILETSILVWVPKKCTQKNSRVKRCVKLLLCLNCISVHLMHLNSTLKTVKNTLKFPHRILKTTLAQTFFCLSHHFCICISMY